MDIININEKFAQVEEFWHPHVVAAPNGQHVRIARLKGEFVWHSHEDQDELFWVIEGRLTIRLRDGAKTLGPGEMLVVPRGVEHCPVCGEEVKVVLFEPASTVNTGSAASPLRRDYPPEL
jgi:mannose-6-phosphate isomerase-like protein (cupin superfamily)